MNTETTVNPANRAIATDGNQTGWVFYDGDCALCRDLARRWDRPLRRTGFRLAPLQTPGTADRLGVSPADLMATMHLLTADGRRVCGADAYVELARARAWSRPLAWLSLVPGVLPVMRRIYAAIAARRHCLNGACAVAGMARSIRTTRLGVTDWLPLIGLPGLAWTLACQMDPWIFMWSLAIAIYVGCKWLSYREACAAGVRWEEPARLGYLLAWVGMEPREFVRRAVRPEVVSLAAWGRALARLAIGAGLLGWGVPVAMTSSPLAAGWLGMIGCILILHFGACDLLALAWRRAGYPVKTLMNAPTRAVSVGDFWSVRWNRGFHALARRFVHRWVAARFGRTIAVLAVFAGSGLVHDLVITVPAGGGYGWPTVYFLLQGIALLIERSEFGRRLGLGAGWRGASFAWLIIVTPVSCLFPPVFVRNVILPMLQAIGVT